MLVFSLRDTSGELWRELASEADSGTQQAVESMNGVTTSILWFLVTDLSVSKPSRGVQGGKTVIFDQIAGELSRA